MKGIAQLAVDMCDLAEAEGRLLRQSVRLTSFSCALALMGVIFLGGGMALVVAAAWQVLNTLLPQVLAFLVLGLLCVLIAIAFLWAASKCMPRRDGQNNADSSKEVSRAA